MDKIIETLFSVLEELVSAEGTYNEKRAKILAACGVTDRTNLEEFLSWFDEDEEEDEDEEDEEDE